MEQFKLHARGIRRRLGGRRAGAWLASVGLAALLAGCTTHAPPPMNLNSLNGIRGFRDFPVYWVGPKFEGVALTQADRIRDYDPSLGLRLYYGGCLDANSVFGGGGCTLPLEINTVLYVPHDNLGLGPQRKTRIRGVPAVVYDHGNSIELYTGLVLVDVFANTPQRALRAALALRPLNRNEYPGLQLPPPLFKPGVPPQPGALSLPPVLPSPGYHPVRRRGVPVRGLGPVRPAAGRGSVRVGSPGPSGRGAARGGPPRTGGRGAARGGPPRTGGRRPAGPRGARPAARKRPGTGARSGAGKRPGASARSGAGKRPGAGSPAH